MLSLTVKGIPQADAGLQKLSDSAEDLRPLWARLGRGLADESQRLWPLRRGSGRLRRSLRWTGSRLDRGGIFESSPSQLRFGSAIFYGRFFQSGTARRAARTLIHVDAAQHAAQLSSWLGARADKGGLEVT